MGCNALRTSHNPPTAELLDACDQLGMLVFDETRMMSSNPEGLSQFADLVRRDRNHPSVFMWSMGNEEGQANTEKGLHILTAMKAVADEHDGSRPVSIAPIRAIGVGGLVECDVMGYNYMDPGAEAYHKEHPDKPVIGTETVSAVGTRGIYVTDAAKGYVGSYDPYTTTGRASAEGWWSFCNSRPWLSGGFVWTGFDYRGEPSPNEWPNISSQYGIIDTCGFPKDTFFYYQSWWTDKPVLHLFPHWNWPGMEGKEIAVWVYSNLDKVELFLNGQSLGAKEMKKDSHLAWNVKYAPGAIEARGYKGDKVVMTAKRETTGPAAKLVMTADRPQISADGEDVAMFAVEVQRCAGPHRPHHRQRSDVQGLRRRQADRHRQRRPHQSGTRQGHRAQGLLRSLHGRRPIHQDSRQHHRRGHLSRSHRIERHHRRQLRDAPSAGRGLGTRSSHRHRRHRAVAAHASARPLQPPHRSRRRRQFALHASPGRRQSHRNRRRRRHRRLLRRQRRARTHRRRQSGRQTTSPSRSATAPTPEPSTPTAWNWSEPPMPPCRCRTRPSQPARARPWDLRPMDRIRRAILPCAFRQSSPWSCIGCSADALRGLARQSKNDDAWTYRSPSSMQARTRVIDA